MTSEMHIEDIMVWPCGSWCYRCELPEMTHMSDDYKVIHAFTPEWDDFIPEFCSDKHLINEVQHVTQENISS